MQSLSLQHPIKQTADELYNQGKTRLDGGDYQEALAKLGQALKIRNAGMLNNRGGALGGLGDVNTSIQRRAELILSHVFPKS